MNPKLAIAKLDRIYYCTQLGTVFLFRSDVEDHTEMSGHDGLKTQPLR
ncbi:MAG TPA: hypothetical protein VJZ68_07665 [Nitrososphaera sp.]|nr:hypothetical protein [Nitrososphaera sp.]